MPQAKRPPVGVNPDIPLVVQRELRKVAQFAFDAQANADKALQILPDKLGKNESDLLQISGYVSKQVQADGKFPINLAGLLNGATATVVFPGAGFTIDGVTYHTLVFQNGALVSFS